MQFNPIGPNQNEVRLNNGTVVFISYKTPVAAFIPNRGYIRSEKFYSVTTSKHVRKWLGETSNIEVVEQEILDNLIK